MEKPFDMEVVDALVARALRVSLRSSSPEPADPSHRVEEIAGRILSRQKCADMNGSNESVHASAGFKLAFKLC
jgi:hypothetical protein